MAETDILRLLQRLRAEQALKQRPALIEDPEYSAELADLEGRHRVSEAEYLANETETKGRYARTLRQYDEEDPLEISGARDNAAARGMYYAGGRVEQEGQLRRGQADRRANLFESQNSDLNALVRGITGQREEVQRGITVARQNAAARALERAQRNPQAIAPMRSYQAPAGLVADRLRRRRVV